MELCQIVEGGGGVCTPSLELPSQFFQFEQCQTNLEHLKHDINKTKIGIQKHIDYKYAMKKKVLKYHIKEIDDAEVQHSSQRNHTIYFYQFPIYEYLNFLVFHQFLF